ncbi:MAG: hypothetical protein QOK21_4548 [Solirubrobacteraceae bacterium]|nr:hypothetical protein [Solirubrobacteraceae bacterium]
MAAMITLETTSADQQGPLNDVVIRGGLNGWSSDRHDAEQHPSNGERHGKVRETWRGHRGKFGYVS